MFFFTKLQTEAFFFREQNILTEGVFVIQLRKSQFEEKCGSQKIAASWAISTLFQKPTLVYEVSLVMLPHHYFMYLPCYYCWVYKIRDHDCGMSSDGMKFVKKFVITRCFKSGDHTYTTRLYNKPKFLISWSIWAKMDLNDCKNICWRSSPIFVT